MSGELWINNIYVYNSDSGSSYNVGLSQPNGSAGGFSLAGSGSQITYPKPWRMRHVMGYATAHGGLATHKLPINDPGNSLFLTGTSFTISYFPGSQSFNVGGRLGEKRAFRV